MAAVRVAVAARRPVPNPQHLVSIFHTHGGLRLAITSPKVDYGNRAPQYVQLDRGAGLPPLLRQASRRLNTMMFTARLVRPGRRPVDADVALIQRLALTGEPFTVAYGPGEVGRWVMTGYTPKSVRREEGTNAVTEAECAFEFTEYLPVPRQPAGTARPAPSAPAKAPTVVASAPRSPARVRVHVVRRGETLSGIAAAELRAASRWPEIAKLNRIRDPRKLRIGTRLRLP